MSGEAQFWSIVIKVGLHCLNQLTLMMVLFYKLLSFIPSHWGYREVIPAIYN